MPFTLAHPLAALPLARPLGRAASLSALCIGSCVPDLHYFFPLPMLQRTVSHSLAGLLWLDLPVAFLLYSLWHLFFKAPLIALAPRIVQVRLPRQLMATRWPPVPVVAVLLCLVLGGLTHLGWDAFTHDDGGVVTLFPILRTHLITIGGYPLYPYKLLQHGSSVVGMLGLALWFVWWLLRTPASNTMLSIPPLACKILGYCSLLGLPVLAASLAAVGALSSQPWLLNLRAALGAAAMAAGQAGSLGLVIYGAMFYLFPQTQHRPTV